jgi:nucleoside-diphosphate-sugar epimerase
MSSQSLTSTSKKQILVTGGSGLIGQHVIEYLLHKGHQILNLDLVPIQNERIKNVRTLKTDLTDAGQAFDALLGRFDEADYDDKNTMPKAPDAVVHLAGEWGSLLSNMQ